MEARHRITKVLLFLCGISCPATAFSAGAVAAPSSQPPVRGIRIEDARAQVTVIKLEAIVHDPAIATRGQPLVHRTIRAQQSGAHVVIGSFE